MLDSECRDGSVDFNCGPEGVKNDEFAGTENKAENAFIEEQNHVCDVRILPRTYYDLLPLELLEAIFLRAIMTSDFLFPNHACRTYNNLIEAYPVFNRVKQHLPSVHLGDFRSDPQSISSTLEITTVSIRRISKYFGPHSGVMSKTSHMA